MSGLYPGVSLDDMLAAFHEQYLRKRGWMQSVETRRAIDSEGAVPWITYPALEFLRRCVRSNWRVCEYGSGSSTIWWSRRVAHVLSIDHNVEWHDQIRAEVGPATILRTIPEGADTTPKGRACADRYFAEVPEPPTPTDTHFAFNAGLLSRPFSAYATAPLEFPPGHFDVVVIDGMARCLSTWVAAHYLNPSAMVVFDNTDRPEYAHGYRILQQAGYHRIDFWGPGPINPYEWCTSVFLRDLAAVP